MRTVSSKTPIRRPFEAKFPRLMAEDKAVQYLKTENFTILARNRIYYGCEIDIIAKKYDEDIMKYYFFEVKQVEYRYFVIGAKTIINRQVNHYHKVVELWQKDCDKEFNVSIGLVLVDERFRIISANSQFTKQ